MTEYVVGTTVVLEAEYYSQSNKPIDPDETPTCDVKDSRGRVVQTNVPVVRVSTGYFTADCVTVGWAKGTYTYFFTAHFDGKPDLQKGEFVLE